MLRGAAPPAAAGPWQLGPWAARGPRRSCTALYEAAPPAVGSTAGPPAGRQAVHGLRKLRVDASCSGMHTVTSRLAGRETILGSRAASGPEELRDSERTYASTHAYLGTAGRGTVTCSLRRQA
jgi:hypothetical protein